MADIIGWVTDVLALEFTIGLTTISLGALAVGFMVFGYALSAAKRLGGKR